MSLSQLTNTQIDRLWRKVYDRITEGGGYQPFGWDWPTLRITRPGLYRTARAVAQEIDRRNGHN
jgi:hypothetical protein